MPTPTTSPGATSPRLHNDDLAPARERPWGAFSLFNVWTADVHSLYGYYLAASLFLVARDVGSFLLGIGAGSMVVYLLMNAVGYAGQRTGVPYPVLARAAFGVFGANVPALVRAIVAVFWFGAQTSAAAHAIVAFLLRFEGPRILHESSFWLAGHSSLDAAAFLAVWAGQLLIISRGMDTVRWFTDFAGPAVWLMMALLAGSLVIRAGGVGLGIDLPADDLTSLARGVTGLAVAPGSLAATAAVAATWVTYFAALYLNFCDFTRFAPSREAVRKGNLWGLPVNLVAFSFVAAVTTGSAYRVYGQVLLSPDAITARFDSLFLALLAALTFAVATLGINVVANFVSPAYDFANLSPQRIDFRRGGYLAAGIALLLYPLHPWDQAPSFVNALGSTMGPLFGVIMVDYYRVRRQELDIRALYTADVTAPYYYRGGWNPRAFLAAGIGALFSSVLPMFGPTWYGDRVGPYGWFIGVVVAGGLYSLVNAGGSPGEGEASGPRRATAPVGWNERP